ncbi:ImpB/MucB/SamB family protein [Leptospira fainei serovar Hurstbridge str. BUT 6]|uniref:DNA polymerase IV n=1 Tax=Leptospira fainei serovar Hurstbridge str. BUT 6 TaxID=1193011 RepID=S3UZ24_9LEPT|nr:DNA polymerase IV [Leptospira fainei]EPG74468.1 ImpB/MucB/SamB family protein [Leptospira fainei serovar Hurstbridge str. BUT 6]
MLRKILHIDMDAFFASVEQRDFPQYRGKPLVVGGPPNSRGVVCAASYEARKFGIRSAMPCSQAYRLCPEAIFVSPRFQVYKEVSTAIRIIFLEYTDLVEMLSLDEAFLDVTQNKKGIPFATEIAKEIRARIKAETNLTASAGVAINKFAAKVATDFKKPDGLTVIRPEETEMFIESLDVGAFPGVGKVTLKKMHALGIFKGSDLKRQSLEFLLKNFGKTGRWYYSISRGIDQRPVLSDRIRKSLGAESTFATDLEKTDDLLAELKDLSVELEKRLSSKSFPGRTITLKIKFSDFTLKTRSRTLTVPPLTAEEFFSFGKELLEEFLLDQGYAISPIRLLGLSLSHPETEIHEANEDGFVGSLFPNQESFPNL